MSTQKAIEYIYKDDSKNFESELTQIKNKDDLNHITTVLMYKNDIEYLHILIDHIRDNDIVICCPDIVYMADNDQLDFLKIIYDSNQFEYCCLTLIFRSKKPGIIDKALQYQLLIELDIIEAISTIYKSIYPPETYKYMHKKYPEMFDIDHYQKYTIREYEYNPNTQFFKDICELVDPADPEYQDYIQILCKELDLEKYNILVQKIPNEIIINKLLNTECFNFNPDLIDIIGLRAALQSKIDLYEAQNDPDDHLYFSYDIVKYSGLNFHKKTLLFQYKHFDTRNLRAILSETPTNYFTEQEKSDHIVSCIEQNRVKNFTVFVNAGWKVFDTPENREKSQADIEIYKALPKY